MASEGAVAKRAKLVASRVHWGNADLSESITDQGQETHGSSSQHNIRKWLTTTVEEDAKQEPLQEAAGPLRRNPSSDDDLALGVEASLYGKPGVRTVQEFLRWSNSSPALSRWNSFSSATSGHSGPLSVMDILNLWNDDPEELLLELGFGCDEPDLSGRIPARFINYPSQARGINLQVFLEAQQNRLDLENPDVSNRFRQLEVLQQVTTAFSTLVGSSSSTLTATQGKDLPPEAQERRRRMGMLFRRASKKSLSQIHNNKPHVLTETQQPTPSFRDKKVSLKRVKPGSMEAVSLSPLAEEQGIAPDLQHQSHLAYLIAQEGSLKSAPLRDGYPLAANTFLQRKKSQGQARESFEMEEVHSFDESSVTGSYTGGAEHLARSVIRTNSCQSDSSGFLEEPFIPSIAHLASPGPDIIKALSGLSERSDSQSSEKPESSLSSPHNDQAPHFTSKVASSEADKYLPSSPCPSPDPSVDVGLSVAPDLVSLSNGDQRIANTEMPPNNNQLTPCTILSPTPSDVQSASSIRGLEEIKNVERSAPSTHPSTFSPDFQDRTSPLASPLSPHVDTQHSNAAGLSSTQPESLRSSCTQSERTKVPVLENLISSSDCLSSQLPSFPHLPHSATTDSLSPPTSVSPTLMESISQTPVNNKKECLFPESDGISFSKSTTDTQKKGDESLSSLSFHLDKANSSVSTTPVLDTSTSKEGFPSSSFQSSNLFTPVSQPDVSSKSHDPDGLVDPTVGRISDLSGQSISEQHRTVLSQKNDDDTDPASACQVQDVTDVMMDDISLDLKGTSQMNEKQQGEGKRHSDTMQAQEVVVSDTETPAGMPESSTSASEEINGQTEMDTLALVCDLHDTSGKTKQKDITKVCHKEVTGTESEALGSYACLHDQVGEAHIRAEVKTNNLIEIESLDLVFETSVDGSDSENIDMDAFFQQLDTEGRVYWAEPIQLSNPTPEESSSFEASDESLGNLSIDSFSSTGRAMPLPLSTITNSGQTSRTATASLDTSFTVTPAPSTTPNVKPSSRSVSVQMPSALSSHIVHRKDVPYTTESKHTRLPNILPLDTSTPFRAVQSWTDLHIQQNALTKNSSYGVLPTVPSKANMSTSCPGMAHRPTNLQMFSSSPSFFLLSNDWKSHETIPEMAINCERDSVSVDTGLWPDEQEEELNRNGNESEKKLWEDSQTATMGCCCSCDHHGTCCIQKSSNKVSTSENSPYSLDELEEMMLCLQQFCAVLSNMEEQLSEDQAAVYSSLSDQDREKIRDIEELRRAVKQEAGELEMQLKELAHDYDESLKMKMHRLLDEQSLLCSQLKVFLPGTVPTSSSPAPNKAVATQCSLLPWLPSADIPSGQVSDWKSWMNLKPGLDSNRQSPPGSEGICEGQGSSPTKTDKLDIIGFLQKLKESLHHSVNTDSFE